MSQQGSTAGNAVELDCFMTSISENYVEVPFELKLSSTAEEEEDMKDTSKNNSHTETKRRKKEKIERVFGDFVETLITNEEYRSLTSIASDLDGNRISLKSIKENIQESKYEDVLDVVTDLCSLKTVAPNKIAEELLKSKNSEEKIVTELQKAIKDLQNKYSKALGVCCFQDRRIVPYIKCHKCGKVIIENQTFLAQSDREDPWCCCLECFNAHNAKGRNRKKCDIVFCHPEDLREEKVPRANFVKRVNTSEEKEAEVVCAMCTVKSHKICVNFGSISLDEEYVCTFCLATYNRRSMKAQILDLLPPQTEISKSIEELLNNIGLKTGHIYVREMSNINKVHDIEPDCKDFLKSYGISGEFPYRSRVIMCFQERDQGLVAFFIVYFQEYDENCPPPNTSSVYISMIDSAQLYEPAEERRTVYYAVLLSYIKQAKDRGFRNVFLWACPPFLGSEYVFYRRPESQKIPTNDVLNKWYIDLLQIGVKRGIIEEFCTFSEWLADYSAVEFFTKLPHFAEDNWPKALNTAISEFGEQVAKKTQENQQKTSRKSAGRRFKVENKEQYVVKALKRAMKINKSFYRIVLNREDVANKMTIQDAECPCELIDSRDSLATYFVENDLEFHDIRNARHSTTVLLKKVKATVAVPSAQHRKRKANTVLKTTRKQKVIKRQKQSFDPAIYMEMQKMLRAKKKVLKAMIQNCRST